MIESYSLYYLALAKSYWCRLFHRRHFEKLAGNRYHETHCKKCGQLFASERQKILWEQDRHG